MNAEELKLNLLALGWRIERSELSNCGWYAWLPSIERQDWPNCTNNEKPPLFCIEPYESNHMDLVHSSVEFTVRGEVTPGQWVDFKVYSVPMNECIKLIPTATTILKAAWTAASSAVK